MKKILCLVMCLFLCSFFGSAAAADAAAPRWQEEEIDLDLSNMSGTFIYAQVFQLLSDYEAYEGKIIRMKGLYDVFQDEYSNMVYFSCVIPDATACCAQGIEFVWAGEHIFPDDFPQPGTDVTVTGRFESYMEGEYLYVHLNDADVIWGSGN